MTKERREPLEGVRVVDLSGGIAGGYATKLLADAGADVISVEGPVGDALRRRGASAASFDDSGDGLLFRYLRTNQRAIVLDLDTGSGREALGALYRDCDVVLDSQSLGDLDARGIGSECLARLNPSASWVGISSFGPGHAWTRHPANDFTLQAWSGSTASRGRPGLPPLATGGEAVEWMTGTYAAIGGLAALRGARRRGRGERVDLSKLEAITPTFTNVGSVWGHFSQVWALPPSEDVPSIEPTADGWIGFCIFTAQQWMDFSLLIERPDLGAQPDLSHMMSRIARADEIREIVRDYTRRFTTEELLERSELLRVPAAPIGHGALLPKIDHLVERGVFVRNPRGDFLQPRIPYVSTGWPRRAFEPAPTLEEARRGEGEGNRPGWRRGRTAREPGVANGHEGTAERPLAGLRVLDLTAFWAGPYGSFVMGCLGADVIHVESIQRPDGMRFGTQTSPDTPQWWEYGPTFHGANTGKRSLTLDLTRPRGIELLLELVRQSDVLIENFSPRVLDHFGLDWERLSKVNPRLVLTRMPAFGLDGPWRNRVGFAQTMEQVCGTAWLTAYPDSAGAQAGPLTPRACADPLAGLHAVHATLLGLAHRDATGEGCAIESAMVETLLGITAEAVLEYDATKTLLRGDANRSAFAAPQGLYACPGSDELGQPLWLAISIDTEEAWRRLAEILGRPDWGEEARFSTRSRRHEEHDVIDQAISEWTRTLPREAALDRLLEAGIAAAPLTATRMGAELDPIRDSGFVQAVDHPLAGRVPIPTQPLRFSSAPGRSFARAAPMLGEHNREILCGILGLSEEEIERLSKDQVIGERPVGL